MEMKNQTGNGKIISMCRYPEKKMPAVYEDELMVKANHGIVGDHHADGGDRQISLLTSEEKTWMEAQEIKGFCFKKYKENILLDKISIKNCRKGDRLICGDVELEFTESIKSCHPELCKLASLHQECILAGSARFAKVKKEGILRKGMEVFCYEKDGEVECD